MRAPAALLLCVFSLPALAAEKTYPLTSAQGLSLVNARVLFETHQGKPAMRLLPPEDKASGDEGLMAVINDSDFHDGTIELELSGAPLAGMSSAARGFLGVAFRIQRDGEQPKFECFYVRTMNGRSDDQTQRNHSAQYISQPDWGWRKLREMFPAKYEAYVDLQPSRWTHLRIVVAGSTAKLYVDKAEQPILVVNDLKRGDSRGAVGLWSHSSTDALLPGFEDPLRRQGRVQFSTVRPETRRNSRSLLETIVSPRAKA